MEDNTGSRVITETRRKSMEDNTRPTENESKEDIIDEGDEEADEEHDQEPEVLVQPEAAVNKAPEVSSAPEEGLAISGGSEGIAEDLLEFLSEVNIFQNEGLAISGGNEGIAEDLLEFLLEVDKFQNEEIQVSPPGIVIRERSCRPTTGSVRRIGATRPPLSAPSFFGTPHKMNELDVGATITSQSAPGQNIVLVRPRPLGQTNPEEHNGPVPMEGDEEIFEEQAVCKNCFHNLKEENILKTECKCGNALIHEECPAEWSRTRGNNNCDSCEQEVQTFPVTLVRGLSSSTQVVDREESNKWSLLRIMKASISQYLSSSWSNFCSSIFKYKRSN